MATHAGKACGGTDYRGTPSVKTVTREQFRIESELEVVHVPTGMTFSAYPYSDPDDMVRSITTNRRPKDESGVIEEYVYQDISRMAAEILIELTQQKRLEEGPSDPW